MTRGRKPIPVDQRGVITSIRLTPARKIKFKQLGGAKWLSKLIDETDKSA